MRKIFMTPSAGPGKPGQLVEEVQFDEGPQQYLEPMAVHDDTPRSQLERERTALVASLPSLKGGERSKADHRIRILERLIRKALDGEEAGRRTAERVKERKTQQGSLHFAETVQGFVKSVAALVAPKKQMDAFDKWIVDVWDPLQAKKKRDQALRDGRPVPAETEATHMAANSRALAWDTFINDPSLRPA